MRAKSILLPGCAVALLFVLPDPAGAWEPVAPGIDYQSFVLPDPNQVYVARLDRDNTGVFIDSTIGQGTVSAGLETVSGMAARYDDTICYWGQVWGTRRDVKVAVNGDFFTLDGISTSGQIISGWYAKRYGELTGGSGFAWQLDRDAYIGQCVQHVASKQKLTFVDTGQSMNIDGVNVPRSENDLIIYTPQYAATTPGLPTTYVGVNLVVEMARPAMVLPTPTYASGIVREIRMNALNTPIPFDHVVIQAHGTAQTTLLANVGVGDEIGISQEIRHFEHDCATSLPLDWTKTYASVGGSFHFLMGGVVQSSSDPGATQRHPRTAIAYNADYIFFIVVDGRSAESVGMSMTELGNFCIAELAATEGINQDGGGSSAMWIDGQIVNVPSDGTERAVANGWVMAVAQPRDQSTRFVAGEYCRATTGTHLRLGPGANYATTDLMLAGAPGVIQDHALSGVRATGTNWWKIVSGPRIGWMDDAHLARGAKPGDLDADGDVDEGDLALWVDCLSGPVEAEIPPGCDAVTFADADLDGDADVDLADFSGFTRALTP